MEPLALFLVLIASISSSAAYYSDSIVVLADSSSCVHLRCEWRGVGKHCKPANNFRHASQHKTVRDAIPLNYEILTDDESEASILARIQTEYPANTFTVINDFDVDEQCKGRRLWCNGAYTYFADDYDHFLRLVQGPSHYTVPPKIQC